MCLWKTPPSLWDEGLTKSLPTLPRWGSMRGGELFQQDTLELRISATDSGALPTPVKYDSTGTWESNNYHGLGWKAKHQWAKEESFPTPMAHDGNKRGLFNVDEHRNGLPAAVRRRQVVHPTPLANDAKGGSEAHRRPDGSYSSPSLARSVRKPVNLQPGDLDIADATGEPLPERVYSEVTRTPEQWYAGRSAGYLVSRPRKQVPTNWPTPTSSDGERGSFWAGSGATISHEGTPVAQGDGRTHQMGLKAAVRHFPTPMGSIADGGRPNGLRGGKGSEHRPGMWMHPGHEEYGELNPMWVEWLMGWPLGWTSLDPLPLVEFYAWLNLITTVGRDGGCAWWDTDPSEVEGGGIVPRVCGKDLPHRVDRIAALGNGQVSACAAAAFVELIETKE